MGCRSSHSRDSAWTLNTARSFKLRLLNNVCRFCNGSFVPCNCSLKISRTELCEEDLRFSQLPVMFWLQRKQCFGCSFVLNKNTSRQTTKVTDRVWFVDAILSKAGKKSWGSGGIRANRPRFLRIPLAWKLSGRPPGDEPVKKFNYESI